MKDTAISLALVAILGLAFGIPVGMLATFFLDGPLDVPHPPFAGAAIGFVTWILATFLLHRIAEGPGNDP